jgi:AbiV family abortive infection protein
MKQLPQYCGSLTPQQVADGINAAQDNAFRLYEDAQRLFDAERYPSACALAVLSIEEAGKSSILRRIATDKTEEYVRKAWRGYRTHTKKNFLWTITELAAKGARKLDDLAPMVDPLSDHPETLDALKQISVYTDCLGKAHWSIPTNVVNADTARPIVLTAKILTSEKRKCTAREIELWVEHLGGEGPSKSKLLAFYEAVIAEGLEDTPIEAIKRFLGFAEKLEKKRPTG